MHLALFSPLPPQSTGIADYTADLLPYLDRLADLTLFVSDPSPVRSDLRTSYQVASIGDFPSLRWRYDMVLYQMGNSLYHREIMKTAQRYPGIIVLHDETLHHLIASTTAGEGRFAAYVRELAYARGVEGATRARSINKGAETPLFSWPLNARFIDISLGTLVHSRFVKNRLLAAHPRANIGLIHQPMPLPAPRDQGAVRAQLNLPSDAFILVTCGHLTPEKRLDLVAEAFLHLRDEFGNVIWLLVGSQTNSRPSWYSRVADAGAESALRVMGYVDGLTSFNDAIAAADVCVNLRYPSAGETSASALRALALGIPVVVSDVGWYRELPDSCAVHIHHDGAEVAQTANALQDWLRNPERRRAAGDAGRRLIAEKHNPQDAAESYVAFIERTLSALRRQYG